MPAAAETAALEAVIEQMVSLTGGTPFLVDRGTGATLLGALPPDGTVHAEDATAWRRSITEGTSGTTCRVGGTAGWRRVELRARPIDGRRTAGAWREVATAVASAEPELRDIIDTLPVWVTRHTPDGRYTFVNAAYCRYMGMTAAQLCAADYRDRDWVEPEDVDRLLEARTRLAPNRPSLTIRLAVRHPDGEPHVEEWTDTALFDGHGRLLGYQSVGRDVTELQRTERELRASEARYRAVVDTQTEWIVRQTPDCRNTFVNEAYRRYMGMTDAELTASDFDDLAPLSPEDRAKLLRNRSGMMPERPSAPIEFRVEHTDGTVRWESWIETAIFDEAGEVLEYQAVGRDISDRVEAELALRESEERYRGVVDAQTEFVTRVRPDGRATFVNDAYCRYMEMSREQLLGPDWDDLSMLAPDDRARLVGSWLALTPDQPLYVHETEVVLPDGRRRIEVWNQRAIFDTQGRLVEVQGVGRDVTEQRATERALQQSEAQLRAILETQSEWVTRQALDNRYTYVNDAYCRYMGMTREQLTSPDHDDFAPVDPEDRERYFALRRTLRPESPSFSAVIRVRHPDGTQRFEDWTETALFDVDGRLAGYQSVGRDITERRRAELALIESEQRFRRFAEAHPVPLCALRLEDWRVLFVNPAYLDLFQLTWEELDGADKRTQWADPARRTPYYERVLRDGMTRSVEVELRRKDGTTFPAALSSRLMELGGVRAVVNSVVDLGPQRAAEVLIAQQREALHQSEKMGALGSLLAGVAHELNNPLSVVVGYASLLKADARGRKLREQAERIHTAAERCARIVKTFLAMARQKPPSFGPVDLARTADAALELAGYALRTSGIEVRRELPEDLPPVHGDADQLHQVMANLVINAQQALQDSDGPRRLEIAGRVVEGHVVLEIRDNGPGMPEEVVRRIFEPFYTTKPAGIGTGLGLSVCHGIVTAHGGRIAIASRPGDGTLVTIALPVFGEPPAQHDQAAAKIPPTGATRQILVVDDEQEIADLVAGVLRRDGHRVAQAADGAEALRRLDTERFDLLVSDLRMPGVDGSSLLRSLRRSHPVLASSAVVLTGDLLSAARDPELQGGSIMLLEKPVDLEELRRVVRARLAGEGR